MDKLNFVTDVPEVAAAETAAVDVVSVVGAVTVEIAVVADATCVKNLKL